jgi:nicotinate-nucleotide pyrophosphorylase (carboxylating)
MDSGLDWKTVDPLIERALAEDIGTGDVTTDSIVPADLRGKGTVVAKQQGITAGMPVFCRVFQLLDPNLSCATLVPDGSSFDAGASLGSLHGSVRTLLKGERTALNFLQRMSGIATLTRAFCRAVDGTRARILDTRKTTPILRPLEKYAVRMGGGENHRFGLFDMVLIKNNHVDAAGGVSEAVERCRRFLADRNLDLRIEVETRNLDEVLDALKHPVHRILLDNMAPAVLREAVELVGGRAETEASGNVRLDNIREIAESGVDCISIGALTHSAPALDISFSIQVA